MTPLQRERLDLKPGFWHAIRDSNLIMMQYLLDRGLSVSGHEVKEALRAKSIPALEMLREWMEGC
jgi:hypothetical protein